jgi:hypothetical protein
MLPWSEPMPETIIDDDFDRIVLILDPGGPVELTGLSTSFASLARYYQRHFGTGDIETAPRLFITRLSTGSIVAEIAPYAVLLGQAYSALGGTVTIADFTNRLAHGIKAFSDPHEKPVLGPISTYLFETPSRADAADFREFVKPLTGRRGAALGIKHARFHSIDGPRETVAEYTFDEGEINRAAANIDKALSSPDDAGPEEIKQKNHKEVMLFFQQASRDPSKDKGRTADRAIVPDISDKALPTYFRKGINDLKDRMIRGDDNPLTKGFIVDVHTQIVDGEPKAYIVTDVHKVMDLADE